MDLLRTIREMFEHNYWSRDHQLRVCAGFLSGAAPAGGAFPHCTRRSCTWSPWNGSGSSAGGAGNRKRSSPSRDARGGERALEDGRGRDACTSPASTRRALRPPPHHCQHGEQWTHPLWRMVYPPAHEKPLRPGHDIAGSPAATDRLPRRARRGRPIVAEAVRRWGVAYCCGRTHPDRSSGRRCDRTAVSRIPRERGSTGSRADLCSCRKAQPVPSRHSLSCATHNSRASGFPHQCSIRKSLRQPAAERSREVTRNERPSRASARAPTRRTLERSPR